MVVGTPLRERVVSIKSSIEHNPGDPAPEDGHYQALNVFGSATGSRVHVREGEPLPPLPRGHTWRRATDEEDAVL